MANKQAVEKRLQRQCAEWQKILRLQDWDVRVKVVDASEVPDCFGDQLGVSKSKHMAEEQAVHALSCALVGLKHGK